MDINTEFIRKFKILQVGVVKKKELKAIQKIFDYTTELYTEKIFKDPDKYVWMSIFIPPEIFYSMDLALLECDFSGGWLCTFGFGEKLLNYAEQELSLGQVCSFHKVWLAALHHKLLPVPKAIVATHYSCDSAQQAANYIHETFGTEFFLLDVPRIKSKEALDYVKKQLIELTSFLSRVTGSKFELEKLKQTVHNANTAVKYWKKAQDLRAGKPLVEGFSLLRYAFTCWMLSGTEEYIDIAKTLYDELKEKSRGNTKILDENCRLMWLHLVPYYIPKMETLNNIERMLGAPVVMDSFSYPYHDYINEEDPFLGLAEKILAYPYINMEKSHNKYLLELARKFRVDGVIQLLPMGCRACHGLARIKQDSFRDLGIPMLLLDVDTLDSRQYSDSQARTRIEAFVESIINRKQL